MILTKKIEKEIKLVIDAWWENMLNANTKGLDEILDKDLKQIGTVEAEVFFNKKDAINFVKKTADQIIGKIELRNRTTKIEHIDELIIIIEFFDIYVKTEKDWSFYSKARGSYLLQKKGECWKFMQQHISFPDSKAQEGETIALEQITKENIQLRDAVKRRTIELEQKNRELEIEAALERVRSRTMAMHKSEELGEAATVFYNELALLGIVEQKQFLNCGYVLIDEKNKVQNAWLTHPDGTFSQKLKLPLNGDKVLQSRYESWKCKDPVFHQTVGGAELKKHLEFAIPKFDSKDMEEMVKKSLPDPAVFYCGNFSHGYLHIVMDDILSKEEEIILTKFTNVFEMTYTRFLDLQKAEAQAREAQIEASIERVRSRTMAMHKSDELQEVVTVLYEEVEKLNLAKWGCLIMIFKPESETIQSWFADITQKSYAQSFYFHGKGHPVIKKWWEFWESDETFMNLHLRDNQKIEFDNFLFRETGLKNLPEIVKSTINQENEVYFAYVNMTHGMLEYVDVKPFPDDSWSVLHRFTKVFEQTYTRFLDLQKAEDQAREAQIEVSLERVRSRTMAMHSSEELPEVVFELFEQLHPLGFAKWGFQLRIAREDKNGFNTWISTPAERILPDQFHIPTLDHWVFRKYWKAYEKQLDQVTIEVSGDDKLKMDMLLFEKSDMKNFSEEVKKSILDYDYVQFSVASMRYGLLEAIDVEPIPKEQFEILQRFAKVFEQTYTRFLDLQKAEAQAREAQIELALERVRAKALAMHKSEDILGVVIELRKELLALEIEGVTAATIYLKQDDGRIRVWDLTEAIDIPDEQHLTFDFVFALEETEPKLWVNRIWGSAEHYFIVEMDSDDFERCKDWLRIVYPSNVEGFINFIQSTNLQHLWLPCVPIVNGNGRLNIDFIIPPPVEMESILPRLGSAFDLAYKRFEDLQKAEAQAREAQIELALERVRARTMAMQKSEELNEVVSVMYKQLKELGISDFACSIIICDEQSKIMHYWYAEVNQSQSHRVYNVPLSKQPVVQKQWKSWRKGISQFSIELKGKKKEDYTNFMLTETDHKYLPEDVKEGWRAYPNVYFSYSNIKYGLLEFLDVKPLNKDNFPIYKRFAKVFEQTYTRFLDLQKAEAQAREAQIEAALERVRARAMAMRSSNELGELIENVFKELSQLNVQLTRCWIWIFDPDTMDARMWWAHMEDVESEESTTGYFIPYNDNVFYRRQLKAWKGRKSKVVEVLEGDVKVKWDDFLFSKSEMSTIPDEIKDGMRAPDSVYLCSSFNNFGGLGTGGLEPLSDENQDIIYRFARVFDLTYTRFNDLLQAEELAREAHIEAALEKIRARSNGMHKSEELSEVALLLNLELKKLGFPEKFESGFIRMDEENNIQKGWMSDFDGNNMEPFSLPLKGDYILDERYDSWKNIKPLLHQTVGGKKLQKHINFCQPTLGSGQVWEIVLKNFSDPTHFYHSYFPQGAISVISQTPLNKEQESLLIRFTRVFEHTYTRFLDLQKAEAQAREAQIETALERVRSRTMAMHKSEELHEVAVVLYKELQALGFISLVNCGYVEIDEENKVQHVWMTSTDGTTMEQFDLPLLGDQTLQSRYEAWKNKDPLFHQVVGGLDLIGLIEFLSPVVGAEVAEKTGNNFPDPTIFYCGNFPQGYLSVISGTLLTKDEESLLERFTRAFEMTYKRFLDIQKAEEQAREAQIEAALERVRSRSMAMHNSKELREVIAVVFEQLTTLGFTSQGCDIIIYDNKELNAHYWFAGFEKGNYPQSYIIPYNEHPYYQNQINAWRKGEQYKVFIFEGELKKKYDNFLFEETDFINLPESAKRGMRSIKYVAIHDAFMSHGIIETIDLKPISEEFANILQRFAKVFDQTYTRFLDIQKAEEQAREAQIEAALERVRSRTMAMQRSDELAETAVILFKQMINLGMEPNRIYIAIIKDENGDVEFWITDEDGSKVKSKIIVNMYCNVTFQKMFQGWKEKRKTITLDMKEKELDEYLRNLGELNIPFKGGLSQKRRVQNIVYFSMGFIGVTSPKPQPEETIELLKRFASVFNLTYTRFNDLQQAEAQNKIIQAENERKTQELEEARQLQLAMLPKELPKLPNLDIAVYMQTATEVGGDYYDFRVGQDGTLNVALGDATGHGLKAGTLVTIMKGLFTAEAENNEVLTFFNKSSKAIKELKLGRLMMAFVFLKIKGRRLSLSNAGIPPVYIFRSEIEEVEEIDNNGMPLGAMKNFPYKETKIELNKGDVILLLSDGFPELFNGKKEMFGYDRVKKTFSEVADRSSEKIIEHLKNTASDWAGGKEPDDDITFVVLKIK